MPKGAAEVNVTTEAPERTLTLSVQFFTKGPKYTLGAIERFFAE